MQGLFPKSVSLLINFINLSFQGSFRQNGMLGIVIMAGDVGDTMEDYVYFDNKLLIMKAGANTYKFDDHIVWAYINNERKCYKYFLP